MMSNHKQKPHKVNSKRRALDLGRSVLDEAKRYLRLRPHGGPAKKKQRKKRKERRKKKERKKEKIRKERRNKQEVVMKYVNRQT